MQAGQQQGLQLTPMSIKDFTDSRTQAALARGQAQVQSAMLAAASREQVAQTNAAKTNSVNDRITNRLMTATDMASTQLSNIASMNFGVNTGVLPAMRGTALSAGTSLMDMVRGTAYQTFTPEDTQMYNTMAANLYRPLSMLETGGGLQGGQAFSDQIKAALTLKQGDGPLAGLTKLAEARQVIDTGSEVYMSSKNLDPGIRAQVQTRLDALHAAIPWTPADIIAYKKAMETDPQLTFKQYVEKLNIPGSATNAPGSAAATVHSPSTIRDANGTVAAEQF
jgi:hypothetical protein